MGHVTHTTKNDKLLHYHLEVQANLKNCTKKPDSIFSSDGKNGIIPWHFLKILT